MQPESQTFLFHSDLFEVDPLEDEETNPFCYGRSLATWIRSRFIELGYEVEPIIPEDWGWCVVLRRDPFKLWIGCGCDRSAFYAKVTPEEKNSYAPAAQEVAWSCLVGTDVPIWTSFFWKRLRRRASTEVQVRVAVDQLRELLLREPRIKMSGE
jgi:hypothetical protein